jgi:peptide methionine sulfoxide reductase MsrA
MFLVESDLDGPFARSGVTITSHVGYAGGWATGTDGLVCYHSDMAGTLYSDLGHGEVVEVRLDPASQAEQFTALLEKYFEEFQLEPRSGKYSRQDPQDRGPAYRAMMGIPGGQTGDLYQLLVQYNRAHLNIDLVPGRGHGDTSDEYKIYVYDTSSFPFYRGEQYHQFHENTVLGRYVPDSYTGALKATQAAAGLIDSTGCPDQLLDLSQPVGPPPPPDPAWPAWRVEAAAEGAWRIAGTFSGVLGGDPPVPSRPLLLNEYCDRQDDRCYQESGCTLKCLMNRLHFAQCQCSEDVDIPLVDITVSIPATCNMHDQDACGIITYAQQDGSVACEGRLTYLRRATLGPPTIYVFTERITSGNCMAHATIDVAAASGGLGYRNSDGISALLALTGPPPVTEDLMVSADSCEASMATFADRITTECCTAHNPCRNGMPTACDSGCGRM